MVSSLIVAREQHHIILSKSDFATVVFTRVDATVFSFTSWPQIDNQHSMMEEELIVLEGSLWLHSLFQEIRG